MKALRVITIVLCATVLAAADSFASDVALPAAIRQDWLYQVEQRPTHLNIVRQIERGRELAERLHMRFESLDLATEVADLDRLTDAVRESQADAEADDDTWERLYLAVRAVKRRILLKHPAIDFPQLLFIDQPYPRFPTGRPWPHDRNAGQICRHENSHRNGMMATPGGRLLVLGGLDPAAEVRNWARRVRAATGGRICRLTLAACCSVSSRSRTRHSICTKWALTGATSGN